MTKTEALKMALEALSPWSGENANHTEQYAAYHAIKEALAQPEQEPVARLHITETDTYPDVDVEVLDGAMLQPSMSPVNVYTTPPQRKPLTDDWIRSMCKQDWVFETVKQWVRIAEKAHGIGENK